MGGKSPSTDITHKPKCQLQPQMLSHSCL